LLATLIVVGAGVYAVLKTPLDALAGSLGRTGDRIHRVSRDSGVVEDQ